MSFVALYGRFQLEDGAVVLLGTCFGGIADTFQQAEGHARDCVRTESKPGAGIAILPRVYPLHGECELYDRMEECREYVGRLVADMNQVSELARKRQM